MSTTIQNPAPSSAPLRVSVVVPVYNPGASFDDLIASFDRQTLDKDLFEVLLCDDGSDDATHERLAAIARDRPYVRVSLLPHSGWPGTPRNHGIDTARGTYLQFVDQDDWLYDRALEKLCDYADRNGSDVIVGREVGIGRPLPSRIFQRDIPRAKLGRDPLLEMLTPHKMFRTQFLREHGIRFPDGKVRLEDHMLVMKAYFEASTISILASEPCYAWVKQEGSASSSRIDPDGYYPHLETVLDIVEHYTEPGRMRDRLLRHWLRGKILARIAGKRLVNYPVEYRERMLNAITPLVQRRFGAGVDAGLSFPHRIRVALLRADRRDDLLRFAEFEAALKCRATVTSARWSRGGGLYLTVRVRIVRDGVDALVFEPDAQGTMRLTSLPLDSIGDLPDQTLDVGRELSNDHLGIVLRSGDAARVRRIAGATPDDMLAVKIAIDPLRAFGRGDDSRGGPLAVAVRRAGWTFDVPLKADAAVLARAGRSPLLAGRPCTLVTGEDGTVELRRVGRGGGWKDFVGRVVRRLRERSRKRK